MKTYNGSMPMIQVKGEINIRVSPQQVFTLLSDVRECAELNPRIKVIEITLEPAGRVGEGTVFHNRIVVAGRMTEYNSKVIAYIPNQLLHIKTNTNPELDIKYHIKPVAEGCCLEQEFIATMRPEETVPVKLSGWFGKLLERLTEQPSGSAQNTASQQREEITMREELQAQLDEWLMIVKNHLEEQRGIFKA